jgi:enterochelin esterase-like enzyme
LTARDEHVLLESHTLRSFFLERDVVCTVLFPIHYNNAKFYPVVLFNDGQDFAALQMSEIAEREQAAGRMPAAFVVGIHAGANRVSEYGVAARPDYAGRGDKAGATTRFVLEELLPYLRGRLSVIDHHIVYAGFSLGGLMALDAVWNHPEVFARAGVFSGSLWWRQRALDAGYIEEDRIMHAAIRDAAHRPGLKFWFQCGTADETDDRDGDGVIDSIQDTLECIAELEKKSYRWNRDVFYEEVPGGIHHASTWSEVLPRFLRWAFREL